MHHWDMKYLLDHYIIIYYLKLNLLKDVLLFLKINLKLAFKHYVLLYHYLNKYVNKKKVEIYKLNFPLYIKVLIY